MDRRKWQTQFSEWFHEVIDRAGIIDYRYPVKGCGVWLPYGFNLRNNVNAIIRRHLNDSGHEEILFPTLITSDMLSKEAEHIGSFEDQTFWVTRGGKKTLEEEYALRPTSETALAPMLKLWIRSHGDLPRKLYQIVSIFRYETKATKPLIRVREVSTFKEAHTSHVSMEEAERQVWQAVKLYSDIFNQLSVPYVISRRPNWDKFAGALFSIAFDTVFPDGRVLQIGTAHNLGQNFSKAFDISFTREDGTRDYVYQTSYGLSERVIAAVIAIHGDDRGLILPPDVAPYQIVIIPIPYKGYEEIVKKKCEDLYNNLTREGLRVIADLREKLTPGEKFYEWELKGVPLRFEVGPRDIKEEKITAVRRDNGAKFTLSETQVTVTVAGIINEIQTNLKNEAWERLKIQIHTANTVQEAHDTLDSSGGIIEIAWCGEEPCGLALQEKTGAAVLGTPLNEPRINPSKPCAVCNAPSTTILRLARTY